MYNYPPSLTPKTTPSDVDSYLRSQGWSVIGIDPAGDPMWTDNISTQCFTWSEAVTYIMWKRFHLGTV